MMCQTVINVGVPQKFSISTSDNVELSGNHIHVQQNQKKVKIVQIK